MATLPIPPPVPSQGIPDWVNWLGLLATFIGLLVSFIGLLATYRQAKSAKDAAEAAKNAVSGAIGKLHSKISLGNISSTIIEIQLVREYINIDNITAARIMFDNCSRSIRDYMYILESDGHRSNTAISINFDLSIKEISAFLDAQPVSLDKKATLLESLRELRDKLSNEEIKKNWE